MSVATSFPKEQIKIALLENISPSAVNVFNSAGYHNIVSISSALSEEDLIRKLSDVRVLGIRSKTHLSAKVITALDKLMAVGCFCIGTNQVDLEKATQSGIAVFNAPFSNTRSVAELVLASMIMLVRRIPEKNKAAHEGIWKKESNNAHEVRGKKLGIIGYGHIGSQISILSEALGMEVYYYDVENKLPLGNAKKIDSIDEIIKQCDIISIHVPATAETVNLISEQKIKQFKKGQHLINMSRGNVVDLDALKKSMKQGIIAGAALDVYPVEPKKAGDSFYTPLQNMPNVILTPHIGGNTEEAQWNIGEDVACKIIKYIETGSTLDSHTLPELSLPKVASSHRILHIHYNVPGVLSQINKRISTLDVNILGQYLSTNSQVGYVVLDVSKKASGETLNELKQVPHTIKVRILY